MCKVKYFKLFLYWYELEISANRNFASGFLGARLPVVSFSLTW